jgi:hypothetical protein
VQTTASFRTTVGKPELWDPLTGQIRSLPQFSRTDGLTTLPLRLDAYASCFVVFPRKPGAKAATDSQRTNNFPDNEVVGTVSGPWDVAFDPAWGGPPQVRFEKLDDWARRAEPGIRFYSGLATYHGEFDLPPAAHADRASSLFLDLGEVHVMARVRVNGQDCGVAWTAPWRVDIRSAVKPKGNRLEIEVANLWPNRMIGDAASPQRTYTRTTYRPYKATDALLPSGLLGPVRLLGSPPDQ